jgi:hypothetical protein
MTVTDNMAAVMKQQQVDFVRVHHFIMMCIPLFLGTVLLLPGRSNNQTVARQYLRDQPKPISSCFYLRTARFAVGPTSH